MITLKCPKCGAEAKLYLDDNNYSGPRRCWKCHEFFTITIHNNQVTSCEPLSKEDYERQEAAKKAAEKSGGGINFSRQEQPEFPRKAAEPPRSGINFSKPTQLEFPQDSQGDIDSSRQEEPDFFQKAAETSRGGIDFVKREEPAIPPKPPEKPRDNTKPSSHKEPSSQTGHDIPAIFPPERYQTFVPLEDIGEEPEKPQKPKNPPARRQDYTKPSSRKEPLSQTGQDIPAIFPPERYQTFVPLEDFNEKPEKP